jgi:hypothetical protein
MKQTGGVSPLFRDQESAKATVYLPLIPPDS